MKTKSESSASNPPQLFGLVLAGGSSLRMGHDKGALAYHGMPQRDYVYQLLNKVCEKAFLGMQEQQLGSISKEFPFILDQNTYQGPFNGIMSAHETYPEAAWLVLACDLPFMDAEALQFLVQQRDPTKHATAFMGKDTACPEPLACIWEPDGLRQAKNYLSAKGKQSPSRFLSEVDVKIVLPSNEQLLFNANSVEDYQWVKDNLKGREGS
ncbi:NTP transferase domain-containing protein [Flagellimonas sp.]|uniref:NTP transferase domain-containing protein n=1 Tax=Flagellimonas sp. TaxID=2058762 RepID=UPI003BA89401